MLTGADLLAKVKDLGDVSKTDLATQCGYVSKKKDGSDRVNFTAFYEAILEARGVISAKVEKDEMLGEYPEQNDILTELLEDYDADAIKAFIELYGEEELENFADSYQGEMSTAEFAEQLVTDCYCMDIPSFVCVDWNATWDQLSYDYDEQDGYIFCRNW